MEQELHYEKFGSGRKEKRLNNKRERNQTKQYLKYIEIEDESLDDEYDFYYKEV